MKRILTSIVLGSLSIIGFAQAQNIGKCGTDEYTQMLKQTDPAAFEQAKLKFEQGFQTYKQNNPSITGLGKTNPKIIIPVVVHVFHNNGPENLSDAQVAGMIADLNAYFNADSNVISQLRNVRDVFKPIISNTNIEFRLARKDPNGNCTNGIVRMQTNLTSRANNEIKKLSTWDTKRYLNIWTAANIISGIREVGGYAQLPYGPGSWSSTDGLLCAAIQSLNGNTVAHEIGHSFGLLHPFEGSADDSCNFRKNDFVDDTPPTWFLYSEGLVNSGRGNQCGKPNFNTCVNDVPDLPDQQENVMDYFEGPCSGTMFTIGQYERMKYCLDTYRKELFSQENLVATGVLDPVSPCAPVPMFGVQVGSTNTYGREACVGSAINFTDLSYNFSGTATYSWEFGEGANPATSTQRNPTNVVYNTPGLKTIKLTVTGAGGAATRTFADAIKINEFNALNFPAILPDIPVVEDGWQFTNEGNVTWQVSGTGVFSGTRSIKLPGSNLGMYNRDYTIVSPPYNFTGASNPYFKFRYAIAQNAISATVNSDDFMDVQVSSNCGLSWQNLRPTISGTNLYTMTSVLPFNVDFIPVNAGQWKEITVSGAGVPKVNNVRFRILFRSRGGNNLYIDDMIIGLKVGVDELTANDIQLNVYPNPFSTTTNITYQLPAAADASVVVYDIVGKQVATLFEGTQSAGAQNISFDRTQYGLTNGMYFVKIKVGNSLITQKVLVN